HGRAHEGAPRHRQADARRAARDAAQRRRDHRPERAAPGAPVRRRGAGRRDRAHQAGRHGQGRDRPRHRQRARDPRQADRGRRAARGPAAFRRRRLRAGAAERLTAPAGLACRPMDAWVIWVVAACALAVGEIANVSFFLGPFAGGAVVAAVVALLGGGWVGSTIAFLVVSVLLLTFLRPVARRHLRQAPALRTGTAALIGRPAVVLERISNDEGVGVARIDGEVWTARAFDDDRVIEPGEKVSVIEIRGATALVD